MERLSNETNEGKFFMILKAGMNLPGMRIGRENFLRKELSKYYSASTVRKAIEGNPARAGISTKKIEKIANECIRYETNKVSAISAATGIPGGLAMLGTVPADIAQYFGHIVRILQKLIYLYGWDEIYNSDDDLSDEVMHELTLFIGVMFGVNTANTAVAKLAQVVACKVEKDLAKKALTKGLVYPVVKKIAGILGVKMTKQIFAKSVGKIIPIIGAGVSGALTYATFKPSARKLKVHLKSLPMADVNFYREERNSIDVDFESIV